METTEIKELEVINISTFKGHEGMEGINADLRYKGVTVAHVYDDACGGEFEYHVEGKVETPEYKQNNTLFKNLLKKVHTLPPVEFHGSLLDMCLDFIVSDAVTEWRMKKDEKKGILYKVGSGYAFKGYTVSIPTAIKKWDDTVQDLQRMLQEMTNEGLEILNRSYLESVGLVFPVEIVSTDTEMAMPL